MKTTIAVGDTVDVVWLETQQQRIGTVELVEFGAVKISMAGAPQITVWIALTALREAGPGRWTLEL